MGEQIGHPSLTSPRCGDPERGLETIATDFSAVGGVTSGAANTGAHLFLAFQRHQQE